MARARWVEDDEEHAATVVMSHIYEHLDEDDLTPRVAPERETEPLAVLQAEFDQQPLPSPASVEGSLYGPPPAPHPPAPQVRPPPSGLRWNRGRVIVAAAIVTAAAILGAIWVF